MHQGSMRHKAPCRIKSDMRQVCVGPKNYPRQPTVFWRCTSYAPKRSHRLFFSEHNVIHANDDECLLLHKTQLPLLMRGATKRGYAPVVMRMIREAAFANEVGMRQVCVVAKNTPGGSRAPRQQPPTHHTPPITFGPKL